jgi:hypothetical protein
MSLQSDDLLEDADDEQVIEFKRLNLYPKQDEAIFYPRDCNGDAARFSVIEAGTKTGKTVGCICWLFEIALKGPPGNYWWVAPVSSQSKIAYTRMKSYFNRDVLTPLLTPTPTITLPGGQIIWFKSGEDPDNLYGEDVWAAVVDEASRLREEAWHAVRSTLTATRGPVRFIGNVKGRRNWFYDMARRAEKGEPGYSYHKIIAADAVRAGVLAAMKLKQRDATCQKMFSENCTLQSLQTMEATPSASPHITIALNPLLRRHPVVWGWDLAKHSDWTVGTALDQFGRTCRFERFQKSWDETIKTIHQLTGGTPALVDSTGVGDPC